MAKLVTPSAAADPARFKDPQANEVVVIAHDEITESSGLAVSQRDTERFWTHNDSGGQPRLFALNRNGNVTGICRLSGAESKDWEDIASFVQDERPRLLVGDCGDNLRKRKTISLYLLDEPDPNKDSQAKSLELKVTYSDGPQNCEAIAVDPQRGQIVLIAKTTLAAGVYVIPLPKSIDESTTKSIVAQRKATLTIPMVSAMDLQSDTGDIWVINYFQAFKFANQQRQQSIAAQFQNLPQSVDLPRWRQIEAVAVDAANQVWVTSEGESALMGKLRIE